MSPDPPCGGAGLPPQRLSLSELGGRLTGSDGRSCDGKLPLASGPGHRVSLSAGGTVRLIERLVAGAGRAHGARTAVSGTLAVGRD